MPRLKLSTLLITLNASLTLLAVLAVAMIAARLLREQGHEAALERVRLAGAVAVQRVEAGAEGVVRNATLLSERPTLARLVELRSGPELTSFLERFRATADLSLVAVLCGDELISHAGRPLPPSATAAPFAELPARRLLADASGPLLTAFAPLTSRPDCTAVAARAIDAALIAELRRNAGMAVAIVTERVRRGEELHQALRERARLGQPPVAERIDAAGEYVGVAVYSLARGEPELFLELSLPAAEVDAAVGRLRRTLTAFSGLALGLAAVSGWALARRVARPMALLTDAAERAGRGDLATPMPRPPGREVGTLAATMEEMRTRLLASTVELGRRRAEAEAVLSGISDGVFAVDRERRIRDLSPQAAALLGLSREQALGRFCGDVLKAQKSDGSRPCDEDCPIIHSRFRGATQATEQLALSGGRLKAVVVHSAPPAAGEERQLQVLRAETHAEAARRLRDAVLANVSHELKTPLAAQLASLELLAERLPAGGDAEVGKLVESLERGTLRLTQLVDNLLESVRIDAGQLDIRRQVVALDEVIEEAAELAHPLLALRGQRLEVDLPYPLPALSGDAPRLAQVFVNLLANANKYAPAGTVIRIRGEVVPGHVLVRVEDEGPGLPPGSEDAVFERFFRSAGEEPGETGLGLGLAIVRSIVERHGGTVVAEAPAAGCRLRVALPIPEAA